MVKKFSLLFSIVCHVFTQSLTDASIFGSENWDTLRVTWGFKIWSRHVFQKMPLTESEAKQEGFERINSECQGNFLGYRYMIPKDTSFILLFDVNGYIAGVQSAFPKDYIYPVTEAQWFQENPGFNTETIDGIKAFTTTAYFVDPNIICTSGRTETQAKTSPTGTQLSIQIGPNPLKDLRKVPNNESEVEGLGWTKGRCFYTMGNHYWFKTSKDMDCNHFFPAFLLYNRNELSGFGWAVPSNFVSERYEHPPKEVFQKFFAEVPECLYDMYDKTKGFTTQHLFMKFGIRDMFC